MAKAADAVVLVLGTDLTSGAEGHDATTIALSDGQQKLVKAVAEAAANPVVVVMLTHIPLDISAVLSNEKVGAVLHAGQPSVQTLGIGDLLFGERVPAGRLIQTVYPASYVDQVSQFDFNMRPGPSAWPRPDCPSPFDACQNGTNPGRTHRFYTGDTILPFGWGLSYTTWNYQVPSVPSVVSLRALQQQLDGNADGFVAMSQVATEITVKVTNTGDIDADDAVLGFLTAPGAGKDGVPLQSLFGFDRVHVRAGESLMVTIPIEMSEFSQVGTDGIRRVLAGDYKVHFGLKDSEALGMGFAEVNLKATLDETTLVL